MELELKHLSPYLPYGLNIKLNDKLYELIYVDYGSGYWEELGLLDKDSGNKEYTSTINIKPILRPVSHITKDEFNDLYENLSYQSQGLILRNDLIGNWAESMRYYDFKKLLYNHFDVFGLIDAGLAIDINTLK